jgi:glycosyltransferase involved in cell wall biosynthesis
MRNNISICMASYNGQKYIEEQIDSVLKQLIDGDELIIIDDNSTDNTVSKIKKYKEKNIGVNKSFEKGINLSTKKYIFLVDQDDIWVEKRVEKMLNVLENNDVLLVTGNQLFIDKDGKMIEYQHNSLRFRDSNKVFLEFRNIFLGKSAYYGCAMAFNSKLKKVILPFPNFIESHDLWIAKAALIMKKNFNLEDAILYRRVHGENTSIIKRNILRKIKSRFIFLFSSVVLIVKIVLNK